MTYSLLFVSIYHLILGIIVYRKQPVKSVNRLFFIFCIFSSIWVLTNFLAYKFNSIFWWINTWAVGGLIAPLALVWVINLIDGKVNRFKASLIMGFAVILFILIDTTDLIIRDVQKVTVSGLKWDTGPLFIIYSLYSIIVIMVILFYLGKGIRNSEGLKQAQLKYVAIGVVGYAIVPLILSFILPIFGINKFEVYDPLSSVIFLTIISYAILRHRFMDIKFVLKKSLIYFLSFVLTLGLYTYFAFLLKKFFQERLALSESASLFVLIFIIAVGFPLVKQIVDQGLKKYVFQKKKDPAEILRKIKERVDPSLDLEVALQKAIHCLRGGLPDADMRFFCAGYKENVLRQRWPKAEESFGEKDDIICYLADHPGEILVKEELSYLTEETSSAKAKMLTEIVNRMEEMKASVIVPLAASDPYQLIGLLILGPKKQGQLYTVQDIEFLKEFADCFLPILFNIFMYWRAVERAVGLR